MSNHPRSAAYAAQMGVDFPGFAIVGKRSNRLQRAIHVLLILVTFGGQRSYLTRYHTVLFGKLWVPDSWGEMADLDRYVLLRHERVHLEQRRRYGDVGLALRYLLPPLFLAYGRARIEWEAYIETLRATAEVYGLERAASLRTEIVRRFVGPDYGWMWPFPGTVNRWFDQALSQVGESLNNDTTSNAKEGHFGGP